MDDLNGLDWSATAKVNKPVVRGTGNYNYYASSSTSSGRATPIPAPTTSSSTSRPTTSQLKSGSNDSFSDLVSFSSAKQSNNLSLAQQQAKLQADKAQKLQEQQRLYDEQFGAIRHNPLPPSSPSVLSSISTTHPSLHSISPFHPSKHTNGAKSSTPFTVLSSSPALPDAEDDLFAAFSKDTKVDASSHYPPPNSIDQDIPSPLKATARRLDLNDPKAWSKQSASPSTHLSHEIIDDDPFGLQKLPQIHSSSAQLQPNIDEDDDDFLGDLGKPVEEVRKIHKPEEQGDNAGRPAADSLQDNSSDDPWDRAVKDLVDMGFSAENAARALTESGSGLDVQAAVGWLLQDAHRQSKEKANKSNGPARTSDIISGSSLATSQNGAGTHRATETLPPWMRQSRDQSQQRRADVGSSAIGEGDLGKTAAAVGSNLLKTANSLWKTSQKKVQQAVSDFQHETDPGQPKWMRSGEKQSEVDESRLGQPSRHVKKSAASVTDEALMLEETSRPQSNPKKSLPTMINTQSRTEPVSTSRNQSPALSAPTSGRSTPIPRWQSSTPDNVSSTVNTARTRLNQAETEEQSTKLYVRRRKAAPTAPQTEEPDLLSGMSSVAISAPARVSKPSTILAVDDRPIRSAHPSPSRKTLRSAASVPARSSKPARNIPAVSPVTLASSNRYRLAGTEQFKRGDYASAHASYSSSLSVLPGEHPITIVLLCNRSLTSLKTGDPKQAVSDADAALLLIGDGRGDGETIDLDGAKPMKDYFAKALTRKAEALEQMERWLEAKDVWQVAIEAGSGGASAAQGRERCEKALAPKSKPKPAPKTPVSARAKQSTATIKDSEAVTRLRAANAASVRADDERFALSDSVDARIKTWRDGRQDNLRALLGGMDQVLWADSGWKKVGMSDLIMTNKVKINYMKAIAKVHPDKLAQDASVEVQMISAAVFATLNEAWDKFKEANQM